MPKIGDVAVGRKIGIKGGNKFIWIACPDCKRERWVMLRRGKPRSIRCNSCAITRRKGSDSPSWKGGRRKRSDGYINVWTDEISTFAEMRTVRNCILEHRLVMAQHLGRCLESWELVHHKNHIRDDNRIENLELCKISEHQTITILEIENKRLKEKNKQLRGKIMSSQEQDKIEDLEDEITTLREVRDELMENNEKLRKELKMLKHLLQKKGGEIIED